MFKISDYINMKAVVLENKLIHGASLCGCRSLRFDQGILPDYSDDIVQNVYSLRYGIAYAFEYTRMYSKLLPRLKNLDELEVVSLGCGTMIDYWSLKQVLPKRCRVRYHGVDVVNWNDKFPCCVGDEIDFSQQKASEYLNACEKLSADVYIFPKSISELDDDEIEKICQALLKNRIGKEEVHFLFSMRSNDYNLSLDMRKTTKLYEIMSSLGMVSEDSPTIYHKGLNKMIFNCDRRFAIDELSDAYDLLDKLPNACENYRQRKCSCAWCVENRNQPMLKCMYMRYQVFTFRKAA